MAPPPTPTSLMDLPASWLLKLATRKTPFAERSTPVALFRTCAFFRDTVLQHRTALAEFGVPTAAERFPAELARLCTVARRSSNVKLTFVLHVDNDEDDYSIAPWTHTEPHITHLLVCAMAELGGPLTCVKEVHTKSLQQTALVPAWLKVCCPNVKSLTVDACTLTPLLLDLPPAPAAPAASSSPPTHGLPSPLMCQHLEGIHMFWYNHGTQWRQHIRQQLAALPSLTFLATDRMHLMLEPALVSASVMSLGLVGRLKAQHVAHLAVQFPNLRQLDAWRLTVDDAGLEALFRLPHLERLSVGGISLQRSHAHRTWALRHISVETLDVGSFARLPLDSVQTCTLGENGPPARPSGDTQAVARVAEAVRRWGGLGRGAIMEAVEVDGRDTAALLTTLGPLLAALPSAQRGKVVIEHIRDVTPATLQALGQQLPASVANVQLWRCTLKPEALLALLPSLPASVTKLSLCFSQAPTEGQLVALCGAAVRRITVAVRGLSAERVKQRLAELGKEQLVTLETWDY